MSIEVHQPGVDVFDHIAGELPGLLQKLLAAPAAKVSEHEQIPNVPGIYLFTEGDKPIYVGQTRILRDRLSNHTNPLAKNNQATFAFLVAKVEAEKAKVDIKKFRKELEEDEAFAGHFQAAKLRVSDMDVRFLLLDGPIERSVFEIYAAMALDTLVFNSFETH